MPLASGIWMGQRSESGNCMAGKKGSWSTTVTRVDKRMDRVRGKSRGL